ncbi:MAG TPA: helix-turn-helix domain-containing protein [Rhodopseudomonas sp.]|uniref:TetR/AcrR family transcriptional regulator n=1 Tax=Rhodopseudomonas sp. TaxID=1078 RepID=UPI002ED8E1C6
MDNATRSERSRTIALDAALTIVARDGPGRLTLDAIARESGLSKGGVMHQFRTKEGVLRALLKRQMSRFDEFATRYRAKARIESANPELATDIATVREAINSPNSAALALLAAMAESPDLMAPTRESDLQTVTAIKAEATDQDLAMLRWAAARGLLLGELLGMSPIGKSELDRLFARLLDDTQWSALERPAKPRAVKRALRAKATTARERT